MTTSSNGKVAQQMLLAIHQARAVSHSSRTQWVRLTAALSASLLDLSPHHFHTTVTLSCKP
uniref:Uncharacterized protein n=1 Tax=Arundo donax TaxID=35708 RepID=A0A0A9EZS7_ARUDO